MAKIYSIDQLIRDEWARSPNVGSVIKQLTIWDAIDDSGRKNGSCVTSNCSTHESTHSQITGSSPKNLQQPTHEHTQWVQEYYVTRRGKKHKYFRFCYLEEPGEIGSCVRVHLPGGNITNPRAIALKEKVEWAIAAGMSSSAIVQIIKSSANS